MIRATSKAHAWGRRQVLLLLGWQNSALISGIARYGGEAGWALDISYERVGEIPSDWTGDGVVTLITAPRDYKALQPFLSLPLVDLSRAWVCHFPPKLRRAGLHVPRVLYNNACIGRLAAEHLLERGFKNLAMFNYGNFWMESERLAEFRRCVVAGGGRFHEIAYHEQYNFFKPSPSQTRARADRWLMEEIRKLPKPVGIFVSADDLSYRVFRACAAAQVLVPEEVAVLGCDNDPLVCDFATIPLSSVAVGWETIGYEAARLLDHLMDGKPAPKEPIIIPPTGVVTRMSTDVMAVPHPKVARALRHIWTHFHEPIQTPDVARAVGMTRRGLEDAFAKHLDRTVANEIARCRIEQAKRLLLQTDLKAHEVAERSGFSSIVHLSDAFLRLEGVRPSHFRKQHASRHLDRPGRNRHPSAP